MVEIDTQYSSLSYENFAVLMSKEETIEVKKLVIK